MGSDFKKPKRTRDPKALRRFRLDHLGELCERCAMRPGVHVHHKTFRSQGGGDEPSNCAWLCGRCHDEAHGLHSVWY